MLIYILFFILISFFALIVQKKGLIEKKLLWFFLFFMALLAGFRSEKASTDYIVYLKMINNIKPRLTLFDETLNIEPFFFSVVSFLKYLNINPLYIFLIFAIIATYIKGKVIVRDSDYLFISLLVYFSNFFLLHEMTQIRAGVAVGIFLFSIPSIINRNIIDFTKYIILAMCFHYSAILYFPVYFIGVKIFPKFKYLGLLVISIIIGLLKIPFMDYLKFIPIELIQKKQDLYQGNMDLGVFSESINLFNVFNIIDILICLILIFNFKKFSEKKQNLIVYAKTYILGVCFFFLLSSFPPVAFRIKELFIGSQFIILPALINTFPKQNELLVKIIIVIICLILFYINIYYNNLVKAYV